MRNNSQSELNRGHRERLRARLALESSAMADYELLELLLGLCLQRKDTKPLAKELLNRFGSIRGCLDATTEELIQVDGFGNSLSSLWLLLREIMARYAAAPFLERKKIASPEAVAEMALARLSNLAHEESWLALVNTQNMLISWERINKGSIDYVPLEPRAIIHVALSCKASGLILVHNHPGGNPMPSRADIQLTRELQQIAPKLGLRMLDHIIIAYKSCYSFEKGELLLNAGGTNAQ